MKIGRNLLERMKAATSGYKKGQMGVATSVLSQVFVVGILLGIFLLVLGAFQGAMTVDTPEYNATGDVITAIASGTSLVSPLVIIGFAAAIISVVGIIFVLLRQGGTR